MVLLLRQNTIFEVLLLMMMYRVRCSGRGGSSRCRRCRGWPPGCWWRWARPRWPRSSCRGSWPASASASSPATCSSSTRPPGTTSPASRWWRSVPSVRVRVTRVTDIGLRLGFDYDVCCVVVCVHTHNWMSLCNTLTPHTFHLIVDKCFCF